MGNSQHTYVISLKTAVTRRNHIINEFSQHDVAFQFFDAIIPGASLEASMANLVPNLALQNKLSAGEKACFMSHVELWKKCIDDNLPFIHIFEDDVLLGKNAPLIFNDSSWIEKRFSLSEPWVLKTETFLSKVALGKSAIPNFHRFRFLRLYSSHYGMAGYTLSQEAARCLLMLVKQLPVQALNPIDHILFRTYLNDSNPVKVYQLAPAICVQADRFEKNTTLLSSQLEKERTEVRVKTKEKKSIMAKLIREIKKIPLAIKKLGFKQVSFER